MAVVDVVNLQNKAVGSVELSDAVFLSEIRKDLINDVVRWQLASRRSGNHMTKTKGLVSGGGKKPFKQKGTGGARQGSSRSPLMPGGGTIFGPAPRDYSYSLPRGVKKAALRSSLSYLYGGRRLVVVDSFASLTGKTKEMRVALDLMGLKKCVVVLPVGSDLVVRAARNLPGVLCVGLDGLNVFDLLKYDGLVLPQNMLVDLYRKCGL